jgi:hypothetical protein
MKMNHKMFLLFGALCALLLAVPAVLAQTGQGVPASCSNQAAASQPAGLNLPVTSSDAKMVAAGFGEEKKKVRDCTALKTVFDKCLCQYNNCNDACKVGDNDCVNKCTKAYKECK